MRSETHFENGTLTIKRIYRAPRELVFEAWFETSKIKQWWGCAECIDVRSEVERKVGGKYNHHMTIENEHGRHDVPGFATLAEYDPPNQLAYTSPEAPDMMVTVEFAVVEGGTLVSLTHSGIPDMIVDGGAKLNEVIRAGWTAAFSKLSKLMEQN